MVNKHLLKLSVQESPSSLQEYIERYGIRGVHKYAEAEGWRSLLEQDGGEERLMSEAHAAYEPQAASCGNSEDEKERLKREKKNLDGKKSKVKDIIQEM